MIRPRLGLSFMGVCCMAPSGFAARTPPPQPNGGKWVYTTSKDGGRTLTVDQPAVILGQPEMIRVEFSCSFDSPKEDLHGALSIQLTIPNSPKFPQFHFDDFEGPDSAIGSRKLMNFQTTLKGKVTKVAVSPSGSLTDELKDGFKFEASEFSSKRHSPVRKVFDEIKAGAEFLEIAITDSKDPKTVIVAKVPLLGEQEQFQALLAGLK